MSTRVKLTLAASVVLAQFGLSEEARALLTAGDLAVVGRINNGTIDSFAFAALNTINAGEVIYFTDNGWTGTGFRGANATDGDGNETLLKMTVNATIPFGTIIRTNTTSANYTFTVGNTTQIPGGTSGFYDDLSLSQSGDQITILQNTNSNLPLFNTGTMAPIYQFDDTNAFEPATTSSTGDVVTGLSQAANTAVTFSTTATTFTFNTSALSSGTKTQWLAAIANPTNWASGSQLPVGVLGTPGPASLVWNNGNVWNAAATSWFNGTGNVAFANSDSVAFTGDNLGSINVSSAIHAGAISFSHTSGTYEFTGNAFIADGYEQTGGGTVVLSANGYQLNSTNKVNIKNGTMRLNGGTNTLVATSAVVVGQSATANVGILDLNGNSQTVLSVEENGSGASKVTSATPAMLTVNNSSGSFTYDGILDGQLSLAYVSNNTNGTVVGRTMTLTGSSTYTGTTSITGGTLRINDPAAMASGNITVNPYGALRLQPVNNGTVTYGTASQTITLNGLGNELNDEVTGDSGALRTASPADGATATTTLDSNIALGSNATISVAQGDPAGTVGILVINGAVVDNGHTLRKQGNGTLRLTSAANVLTGTTSIGNGVIDVASGSSISSGPLALASTAGAELTSPMNINSSIVTGVFFNNATQTVGNLSNSWLSDAIDFGITAEARIQLNGTALTINQTGNTEYGILPATLVNGSVSQFSVTITGNGSLSKAGAGTLTLSSVNSYTGSTSVSGGKLVLKSAIQNGAAMSSSGGGVIEIPVNGGATAVISVSSLTTTGTGSHINLHDNDLVINYAAGPNAYAATVLKVKSGLISLGGTGTEGITSPEADGGIPGTSLAVVDNAILGRSDVSGFTIPNPTTSVIVKFTWLGDANLDGVVDGTDYALTDSGFAGSGTTWNQGDYNYSGGVDGTDYALIDTGFGSQSGTLPEPTALSLLALGAMGMLRRRKHS